MEKKVGLLFSEDFMTYNFGKEHPLKPARLQLTYSLFKHLGLMSHENIDIISPVMASDSDLMMLHEEDYVNTVKRLSEDPSNREIQYSDYVLSQFTKSEKHKLKDFIIRSSDAVKAIITEGFDQAMRDYNAKLNCK